MNSALTRQKSRISVKRSTIAQLNLTHQCNLKPQQKKNLNGIQVHFPLGDRRMSITQKPVVKAWPSVFFMQVLHTYLESGNGVSRNLGLGCYQHYGLLVQYSQRSYIFVPDKTIKEKKKSRSTVTREILNSKSGYFKK